METRILNKDHIERAAQSLKEGDPVIFPTETVYGLAAPIFSEEAVRRIFKIKRRPLDNPLIAHISTIEEANVLSEDLGPDFYLLAEAFWPGPLAIVVKKRSVVPDLVSAGHPTIAIRMPSHPLARELIQLVQQPLVAPSANLSGRPSPTTLRDALEDLNGAVPFALDGGPCEVGIESTVISLCHPTPTLLRPGKISLEMLEEKLKQTVALPPQNGPVLSPGMKYRHYAPKAPIRIVYEKDELQGPYLQPNAKTLYAQLREADRQGAKQIQIYCDGTMQKDAGLMNRLLRASGQID